MTLRELITSLNLPYFSLFLFDSTHDYDFTDLRNACDVYDKAIDVLMCNKNGEEFFVNCEERDDDIIKECEVLKYAKVLENEADNAFKVLLKNYN